MWDGARNAVPIRGVLSARKEELPMTSFAFWLSLIASAITVGTAIYSLYRRIVRARRRRQQSSKS